MIYSTKSYKRASKYAGIRKWKWWGKKRLNDEEKGSKMNTDGKGKHEMRKLLFRNLQRSWADSRRFRQSNLLWELSAGWNHSKAYVFRAGHLFYILISLQVTQHLYAFEFVTQCFQTPEIVLLSAEAAAAFSSAPLKACFCVRWERNRVRESRIRAR